MTSLPSSRASGGRHSHHLGLCGAPTLTFLPPTATRTPAAPYMFFYHFVATRAVYTTKTIFTVSTDMLDYQWIMDASEHKAGSTLHRNNRFK